MSWTNKYILDPGVPFVAGGRDFSGCDCAGLVLLALKTEKGIAAADFNAYTPSDFKDRDGYAKLGALVDKAVREEWLPVQGPPQPFDLVRMHVGTENCHVGLCVDSRYFLHVEDAFGSTARLTSFTDPYWEKRIFEFRRHKDLAQGTA